MTVVAEADSRGDCWCCGVRDDSARMVRLGNHPEVTLCARCARWLAKQSAEIEDRGRTGVLVALRNGLRAARNAVVDRGWQHNRVVGPALRRIGRYVP